MALIDFPTLLVNMSRSFIDINRHEPGGQTSSSDSHHWMRSVTRIEYLRPISFALSGGG